MKEPELLLKKNKTPTGQVRYQVQWKGFDEPTWEPEESLAKYRELIEDFNYFQLTGDHYSPEQMEVLRQQNQVVQPKTAIKRVSLQRPSMDPDNKQLNPKHHVAKSVTSNVRQSPSQSIVEEPHKKEKKNEKINKSVQHIQEAQLQNQKLSLENNEAMILSHQSAHKISAILSKKQQEMTKNLAQCYANTEDQISVIKLQITHDSQCVFQLQWHPRQDGVQPLAEFYSYEQFKMVAPLLFIQFVETCLLQCQSKQSDITFEGPGGNLKERIDQLTNVMVNSCGI